MACGLGEPNAEDCAIAHWCEALAEFGAHREANGQWRANCPVPGCGAKRALEFDAPGKHVRWRSFCGEHDKEAVRPHLAKLVGPCMPNGSRRDSVGPDDLIRLADSNMPPQSLRLAMYEMAGLTTREALDRIGVRRENRSRVINGRRF